MTDFHRNTALLQLPAEHVSVVKPAADWASIAGDVARDLLGEPNRSLSRRHDLRWGSRGSLSVDPRAGVWHDHEAGRGGGVLELVERELGCDRGGALAWLQERGYLEDRRSDPMSRRRAQVRQAEPERDALARALWDAGESSDASPGRLWLASRCAWPPAGVGPDLPSTVRWVTRERGSALGMHGWEAAAIGALVFAWGAGAGDVAAVSLAAVDSEGCRVNWFGERAVRMRSVGSRAGLVFTAREVTPGAGVHVVEGEVDALALAIGSRSGGVVSVGGTSGLRRGDVPGTGCVWIHADGDCAGRSAAERARHAIERTGRSCRIRWYAPGEDPADTLAGWIGEREGLRIADGSSRSDASRGVWMDLMRRMDDA